MVKDKNGTELHVRDRIREVLRIEDKVIYDKPGRVIQVTERTVLVHWDDGIGNEFVRPDILEKVDEGE